MKRIRAIVLAATLGSTASFTAVAQLQSDHGGREDCCAKDPTAVSAVTEGEVRKIDKNAKKVTIKHGPIMNLGMPGMTMVFQVKDPAMLDQLTVGDKIYFVAGKVNGAFTVVSIEPDR